VPARCSATRSRSRARAASRRSSWRSAARRATCARLSTWQVPTSSSTTPTARAARPRSRRRSRCSIRDAAFALCRYDDGRGHPIAFARETFPALATLHGDRGVWRLLDHAGDDVREVPIAGRIPLDVDTQDDYETVLALARVGA
jgi:molybdenum cofactor cytidylyltransferase